MNKNALFDLENELFQTLLFQLPNRCLITECILEVTGLWNIFAKYNANYNFIQFH